jgi:DNA replication protein DnaC
MTLEHISKSKPTEDRTCDKHGPYTAINYIGRVWSGCPLCRAETEAEEKAKKDAEEAEQRVRNWEQRLGQSGIPPRFQDRTLENFVAENEAQQKAQTFAKSYADEFNEALKTGRSALFVGKPGTGKTHLAAGIGMSLLKKGHPVLFMTVMRAIRRVKDTWGKGREESETEAIAAMVEPHLLILDEVGVQFGSDFEKNLIFDIINERYENRLPTILMSNLPTAEVRAYLGDRVFDRMKEDGGARIVFDWESHRGRQEA